MHFLRCIALRRTIPSIQTSCQPHSPLSQRWLSSTASASLSFSSPHNIKQLPPRPRPPPEEEIEESFLKGSGPGGQKINKTNSAVQLKHTPTGIVVKSQATRSREQNRKHARELLAQRLDDLNNGEQSRSTIVGNIKKKRSDSASKKSRRKYRKLEEEKTAATSAPRADNGDAGLEPLATDQTNNSKSSASSSQ
ncbi:Putative RF-1 domain-containing protein [[Torrubiella] hemipterigena]|uniref:Putative RF-1 domain-containing protein n=1 Tax=[Torrubiella] hemipterigena TaxID=1531966 RepID=A0A0A1T4B2_9HYPO|nr:Putative RF-1 domain-containing protein [[Torrubiella] hemipterigena]